MSEWQPIETAPKDGTRIFGADHEEMFICWWDHQWDMESRRKVYGWLSDRCIDFGGYENPTHWMKLPEPPK